MEIRKDTFFRYRNKHGEVVVCVRIKDDDAHTLSVGIAFCNPIDFNLRRDIRVRKGHGLASKRARQEQGTPGCFSIYLPERVRDIEETELRDEMRKHILWLLRSSSDNFGFARYLGKSSGAFSNWLLPFQQELLKCTISPQQTKKYTGTNSTTSPL